MWVGVKIQSVVGVAVAVAIEEKFRGTIHARTGKAKTKYEG